METGLGDDEEEEEEYEGSFFSRFFNDPGILKIQNIYFSFGVLLLNCFESLYCRFSLYFLLSVSRPVCLFV